ncbi:hypothetical protein F5Y17DRAFT_476429 [Xylariaceae sp. FL0594]|nr:hypothetical protein F5Y17DRAFT_476429 [Xylariaceae sp. FL0594]
MPEEREQNIADTFISGLRNASQVSCPVCSLAIAPVEERIRAHLGSAHPGYMQGKDMGAVVRDLRRGRVPPANANVNVAEEGAGHLDKQRKSSAGPSSKPARIRSTSPPTNRRSRARPQPVVPDPDFHRRGPQQGKLWTPGDAAQAPGSRTRQPAISSRSSASGTPAPGPARPQNEDDESLKPLRQPPTQPISQDQLITQVKGIYAGLMIVESKCIEVDTAQASKTDSKLNSEQWQALIALHRTLLHEHHDFFLASQHPSASPALRRLASKYAMPARMWRHGIHSFLELLRHRLPSSFEHMLTFIYLAYSMMALLYETVPAFKDTWIECLGDLGRYRMAIEDDDVRDREHWTVVSRYWLYHHLAILARPNVIQQLFYYTKSLSVPIPFAATKESILTLFEPLFKDGDAENTENPRRPRRPDASLIRAHGILFTGKRRESYQENVDAFLGSLDNHIAQVTQQWLEAGYHIGLANCCALMEYGSPENVIKQCMSEPDDDEDEETEDGDGHGDGNGDEDKEEDEDMESDSESVELTWVFEEALTLAMKTHDVVFGRWYDSNVLPYMHVTSVFMYYLTRHRSAMRHVEDRFPWKMFSLILNSFLETCPDHELVESELFPSEKSRDHRPMPEDFALKGFHFAEPYHPTDFFVKMKVDDDEKYFELPSMMVVRKQRILWLGHKMARSGAWLTWDAASKTFGVNPKYEMEVELSEEASLAQDVDLTSLHSDGDHDHNDQEHDDEGDDTEPHYTTSVHHDTMDIDDEWRVQNNDSSKH